MASVLLLVLTSFALAGAVLTFRTRLVTRLDSNGLHLRLHPIRWNLLPQRMTMKDIALSDIEQWEVRTYNTSGR